jgi:hypothetical protein
MKHVTLMFHYYKTLATSCQKLRIIHFLFKWTITRATAGNRWKRWKVVSYVITVPFGMECSAPHVYDTCRLFTVYMDAFLSRCSYLTLGWKTQQKVPNGRQRRGREIILKWGVKTRTGFSDLRTDCSRGIL